MKIVVVEKNLHDEIIKDGFINDINIEIIKEQIKDDKDVYEYDIDDEIKNKFNNIDNDKIYVIPKN